MTEKTQSEKTEKTVSDDRFTVTLEVLVKWNPKDSTQSEKTTIRGFGNAIDSIYNGSLVASNAGNKIREHVDYLIDVYFPLLDTQNVDYDDSIVTAIETRWTKSTVNQTFPEILESAHNMRVILQNLYTLMVRVNPEKGKESGDFTPELRGSLMGKVKSS